jgi:hypothetical protein
MDKLIKENKITAVILIVLIIVLAVVYFNRQPTKNSLDTSEVDIQTKCASQAKAFFDYWETDPEAKQNDEYSNHYNVKVNKCFVKIKIPILSSPDKKTYTEYLFDAIEKKQYGNFMVGIPTYGKPIICEILDNFCQTRDEYDNFVNSYMEN